MSRAAPRQQGFALFIIAALFVAFALVAVSVIDRAQYTQQLDFNRETTRKLQRIAYALVEYKLAHAGRYPCPADPQADTALASFAAPIAHCENDPALTGTAVLVLDSGSGTNNAVQGMVPLRDLLRYGLTDDDLFDSWGNRIMYVVNRQFTPDGSGTSLAATGPMVWDEISGMYFHEPLFVVLSYGRDGRGAYGRFRTSINVPCTADGSLASRNCSGSSMLVSLPPRTAASTPPANYFDDFLSFYN